MSRPVDRAPGPTETDPDLHPEELLDRAVQGRLGPGHRQVLDRHLSACRACAAHLALIRSARSIDAPEPWDDLLNRRAVEGALAWGQRRGRRGLFAAPPWRRWALVTAAMLLAFGGVAGATWWRVRRATSEAGGYPHAVISIAATRSARKVATRTSEPAAEPHAAPPPSLAPAAPASRPAPHELARTQPSAASLFERASALREQNSPEQAIAVFRRLQRLYPTARASRLSFALAGRLLLDTGHPAQAIEQFDQHLARRGEAAEEALAGRASAQARLGLRAAERETWRTLLAEYPKTVYAPRAKNRLAELER